MEKELTLTVEEKDELRRRLGSMEQYSRVVEVKKENVEAKRRIETEIENIRRDN
jgi:hypothetical protein